MFSKIEVNGSDACDLYKMLKEAQPGGGDSSEIGWNFEKFLVDGDGNPIARWAPTVTPEEIGEQLSGFY